MIRVFLDANIYVAGFMSREGASFLVLELIRREKIAVIASRLVLREADRNLRLKASAKVLKDFRRFLQQTRVRVVPTPPENRLRLFEAWIHPKDVPVLAAAAEVEADYLITLDKQHFFSAKMSAFKKIRILTPGDFIRDFYLKGKI